MASLQSRHGKGQQGAEFQNMGTVVPGLSQREDGSNWSEGQSSSEERRLHEAGNQGRGRKRPEAEERHEVGPENRSWMGHCERSSDHQDGAAVEVGV